MTRTDAAELRLLADCAEAARETADAVWLGQLRGWAYGRSQHCPAAFLALAGRIDGYLFDLRGGAL